MAAKNSVHRVLDMPDEVWCVIELKWYFSFCYPNAKSDAAIMSADQENLVPAEGFELSNTCF